jgi:hypothetical protein
MWSNFQKTTPVRIVVSVVSLLVLLMTAALVKTLAEAEKKGEWATYSHGVLRVAIPYRAAQAGAGRLTVEALDPENHVIGRTEKTLEVVKGASRFRAEMKLDKAVPLDNSFGIGCDTSFAMTTRKWKRWRAWNPSPIF